MRGSEGTKLCVTEACCKKIVDVENRRGGFKEHMMRTYLERMKMERAVTYPRKGREK